MAAPTWVTSSVRHNVSSATYTADAPVSVAAGDLIVVTIVLRLQVANTITTVPTGFTSILATSGGTNALVIQYSYWKLATASEPATYGWVGTNAADNSCTTTRITGQHPTTPINTSLDGLDNVSQATHIFPTITTTVDDCLNIYSSAESVSVTSTFAGGPVERWDASGGTGTSVRSTHGATEAFTPAGSTGTSRTITTSTAKGAVMHTIAIAPAPAAAVAADIYYAPQPITLY